MKVEFDRYSLIINGRREFILSGAIHYYRLPSHRLWRDRLAKLKEAGLNAVDVYFPWNYHSPREGEYDFEGARDVVALMDIIEETGLYLIARPGPYVCSEIDAGGLPAWLIFKKDVIPRCRKPGRFVYSPAYMKYVRQWYEEIVPRIAARNNLILFQVENEYNLVPIRGLLKMGTEFFMKRNALLLFDLMSADAAKWIMHKGVPLVSREAGRRHKPNRYIAELYRIARESGVKVPIFHNDIMSHSERQRDVDIMAIDDYAINTFRSDWRNRRNTFLGIDIMEHHHDAYGKNDPVFIAEFQGGWFDTWGGHGYDHVRKTLGTDQLDVATKSALAQRATLINYFMFAGGATQGYMGSPDVYTSYDMAAPVTEEGLRSERFYAVQWLAGVIRELGGDFLATTHDPSVRTGDRDVFCRARKSENRRYVFLRNHSRTSRSVKLSLRPEPVTLDPLEAKIIVFSNDNSLIREFGAYTGGHDPETPAQIRLPELAHWRFSLINDLLTRDYDDSRWKKIRFGAPMDIDSLGFHHGFVWFRGAYRNVITSVRIDARHCYSIFVNGALIGSGDGYRNKLGNGPDFGALKYFPVTPGIQEKGANVITVLVESLGHNKDFNCDLTNPRGIIEILTHGASVQWKARGGLIEGEQGMCPSLPRRAFPAMDSAEQITLPHEWGKQHGIGIYQTTFPLALDDPMRPVSLTFTHAHEKANVYLNGALIGRYWEKTGPQKKFYLPPGILDTNGENHLAVAVWRRTKKSGLGTLKLE
ncbi:MAG: beta-galactosidase [bacterium]